LPLDERGLVLETIEALAFFPPLATYPGKKTGGTVV
jgi:hypothetical protein